VIDIRPFGDGAGSSSLQRRRFPEPPYDPGRSDFPSPVRSHNFDAVLLPLAGQASASGRHTPVERKFAHSLATMFGSGCIPVSPGPCLCASSLLRPDVPVLLPPSHYAWRLVAGSLPLGPPTAGHQDIADVISAHLARRAWTPSPAAREVPIPVSSPTTSAFPP
jgi:hypothetical protein